MSKIMSRRKKILFAIFGAIIGLCFGTLLRNFRTLEVISVCNFRMSGKVKSPLEIINLHPDETPANSQKNLVFIGVMTAQNFLKVRSSAVYNTWGNSVPGKIAFFSSEGSYSEDLPVIALKGVDDRYPPQKKSFMMLHYMYEHYIDRFEWFMRADDDVFMRTDRLEKFLRSIDSLKPQFIGQAGKGNNEEFGLLSLEFDENFCMGGPGVILSRETLRRVAPHIPTCLKNLYSTHEDVEIGRCVQKFAGIPCTWNYEMQSILHHNSSGNRAFTGNLKSKEVHSAITLHPVKKAPLMYRLHAYMLGQQAQENRQEALYLHRDIEIMKNLLQYPKSHKMLAPLVPIFPHGETSSYYLGDPHILGVNPDLNRYTPETTDNIIEWDFIAKSIYSAIHTNPKRKIESALREGLDDVVREVMEIINNFSRQRGRVIEFRELLYGYSRVNTLYGQDLILDLLLIYKKYRGKKMTVPVRRHLYIQRSFTEVRIREIKSNGEAFDMEDNLYNSIPGQMKKMWQNGLGKLSDTFAIGPTEQKLDGRVENNTHIIFVLPLSGRYETFLRFVNNYEKICINSNTSIKTSLLVILFQSPENIKLIQILIYLREKYKRHPINFIESKGSNFSRGIALDEAARSAHVHPHDILLFIDVDIIFNVDALSRIMLHTIEHTQIYLPIVFSQYNPYRLGDENVTMPESSGNVTITNRNGFFRQFGYGICAIYKSDIMNPLIDGFNTEIIGWGLEDVKFLEKIINLNNRPNQEILAIADHKIELPTTSSSDSGSKSSSVNFNFSSMPTNNLHLNIFRSPDPSLIHVYHKINCDKNLDDIQYRMCLGTKANTLGYYRLLESMFLGNSQIMQIIKRNRNVNSINAVKK